MFNFKKLICSLGLGLYLISLSFNAVAEKTMRLATLDWAPYIGRDIGQGKHGYVYDLVAEACKRAGYKVAIEFYPWERGLQMAKAGQVDGLFPDYASNLDWGVLSAEFPGGPLVLYKRKDFDVKFAVNPQGATQEAALKALSQYTFGVVKGYINTETFDKATFLKKEEAPDDESNLKKLFSKRINFIVIDKYVARHIMLANTDMVHMNDDMEAMEPPLEIKPLYIDFSNKAPDVKTKLDAFNQALKSMQDDGTLTKILSSYGF